MVYKQKLGHTVLPLARYTIEAYEYANDWGVFYGGQGYQLGVQLLGIVVIFAWVTAFMLPMWLLLRAFKLLRVSEEQEKRGLDIAQSLGSGVPMWCVCVESMTVAYTCVSSSQELLDERDGELSAEAQCCQKCCVCLQRGRGSQRPALINNACLNAVNTECELGNHAKGIIAHIHYRTSRVVGPIHPLSQHTSQFVCSRCNPS